MAARVRRLRGGQGWHGRAARALIEGGHGGAPGGQMAGADVPVGHQWLYWKAGNTNRQDPNNLTKEDEEELRIISALERSPRVDPEVLHNYAVPPALLTQSQQVVNWLNELVSKFNLMAKLQQRYLHKALHGCQGKEMSLILKRLAVFREDLIDLHDEIAKARGYSPPTPKILSVYPPRLK